MSSKHVSSYVFELFGLPVPVRGSDLDVSQMLCVKFSGSHAEDKVLLTVRALKFIVKTAYKNCKVVQDERRDFVYVLFGEGSSADYWDRFAVNVHRTCVSFHKIDKIDCEEESVKLFQRITTRVKVVNPQNSLVPDVAQPFTLVDDAPSLFVVEYLDLVLGDQDCLIAAKGLSNLRLVARVIKQNRGSQFLSVYKFVLDPTNATVYIKVIDENDANMMAGRSWTVEGTLVSLYRVLNIVVKPGTEDLYQFCVCQQIVPNSMRPTVYGDYEYPS